MRKTEEKRKNGYRARILSKRAMSKITLDCLLKPSKICEVLGK